MWRVRQKNTGLFWVNERWSALQGTFSEGEVQELDDEKELVFLSPVVVNTANHARGIMVLSSIPLSTRGTVALTAGNVWRGTGRVEFLSEVSIPEAKIGTVFCVVGHRPGAEGNLRAGSVLLSGLLQAQVCNPGFYGGIGPFVKDEEQRKKAGETLERLLKTSGSAGAQGSDPNWPVDGHPDTKEPFVIGNMKMEKGNQKIHGPGGFIEVYVGGTGMLRGEFVTASGSKARGYLNGSTWIWTDTTIATIAYNNWRQQDV